MGMFDSSQPQQSDTSFNYTTQQDKLKRQRLIADQLQKTQQPVNQTVNGAYGGLVVRNNPLTNIAPLLQSLIGSYLQNKTDSDQKDLDKQSLDQFSAQYAGLGNGVRDPKQDQVEADAQLLRETRRSPAVEGGGMISGQATSDAFDAARTAAATAPVAAPMPDTSVALPPSPVSSIASTPKQLPTKKAAAMLAAAKPLTTPISTDLGFNQAKDSAAANVPVDSNRPFDSQNPDASGVWDNLKQIGSATKAKIGAALATIQHFTGADGSKPNITPTAPVVSSAPPPQTGGASGSWGGPDVPAAPPAAVPGPMPAIPARTPMPVNLSAAAPTNMPAPTQAAPPQASNPGMTSVNGQVMPNPFTDAPSAPGMGTLKDGTQIQVSNADPYSKAPTPEQMMPRLIALSRTGPEGQAIANAQLAAMGPQKDRYEPVKNSDGEVTGIFDKFSGRMVPGSQPAAGTTLKGQAADLDARKLVNAQDPDAVATYNQQRASRGLPPLTSQQIAGTQIDANSRASTSRSNDEFGAKIAGERATAQGNLAALDKLSSDLSLAQGLAAKNAGKWAGGQATISQYFGGGSERQALERILNDTRLVGIMQDKENSGTAGAGLMKAYSEHGLNASMQPEALQQGITQMLGVINGQRAAKQAEIGVHDNLLKKYAPGSGQPQAAPASGARTPGNYPF